MDVSVCVRYSWKESPSPHAPPYVIFVLAGFAEQGSIQIPAEEKALNYTYDVLGNNINYRSFQIEVRYSRERLWDCESCPKPDYEKFVNYYGMVRRGFFSNSRALSSDSSLFLTSFTLQHDYADHVITRAFQGAQTDMERGNHDFRWYGWTGRRGVYNDLACIE